VLAGAETFTDIALFGIKKRIKSFCGAQPPRKLGWTNAVRWGGWMAAMEISPGALGTQVDHGGSVDAVRGAQLPDDGRERRCWEWSAGHLSQGEAHGMRR
jgi:hypothetical protein